MCSEKGKPVLSAQLVLLGQRDYCISIYALSAHGKVVNNFNFFVGGKARGIIMKKLLSVFLSLTMLISSAAVMSVPVGAASKTGKKYVTYKTKKKTVKKSGVLILSGSIKYPKLKSKSKAAKKVNKTIKKMVKKDAKYITDFAYKDYKKSGLTNFKTTGWHYEYNVDVKFTYNKKGKYSFKYTYYSYAMGAHGYTAVSGLNFSKKTGKRIKNTKLTKYDPSVIRGKISDKLSAEMEKQPSRYFSTALTTVQNMDFDKFNFWLKGNYLYVIFNPYDISPYMAGPTTFKIKL